MQLNLCIIFTNFNRKYCTSKIGIRIDFSLLSLKMPLTSGQPESFTDAGQVGESHECLEVLQQCAFKTQETDKGAHSLIDLHCKKEA